MNSAQDSPIIALLTDFGTQDHFVGVMKGVIAGICPYATVIDLSHAVDPQNVVHGAFLLQISRQYFPDETIFLGVVDPGVGTQRRPVAMRANGSWFVGPDNGIFSTEWESRTPASDDAIIELNDPAFWLDGRSDTFDGRDIFAPVAAHLAAGVAALDMGAATGHLVGLSMPRPEPLDDGSTRLQVLHIDRFGNVVTNIRTEDLRDAAAQATFSIGGATAIGVRTNFVSKADLIAVAGSSGYVELAAPGGSAANNLNVELGATVILRFRDPSHQASA